MSTVACTRCGETKPALEAPPFKDALGEEILGCSCAGCWKEWLGFQVKLINEMGLLPVNPEHGAVLERNVKAFLKLPSSAGESVDDVGAPPPPDPRGLEPAFRIRHGTRMKTIATSSTLLIALLLLSCGGGGDDYTFKSKARAPEGEAIVFRYAMTAGERYTTTSKMEARISVNMEGQLIDLPMSMDMEAVHECKFVEPDGALRLEFSISRFEGEAMGETLDYSKMTGFDQPGTILLAPDGVVRELEMDWFKDDPNLSKQMKQMQGMISFLRFPAGGLRIGEAVDFREMLPPEMMEGALDQVVPGMEFDIQGEMVFDRLEQVDGIKAAVFLANVVATIRSGNDAPVNVDIDMKITGVSRISVDSGWPIGAGKMTVSASGEMGSGGQTGTLEMTQEVETMVRREAK